MQLSYEIDELLDRIKLKKEAQAKRKKENENSNEDSMFVTEENFNKGL